MRRARWAALGAVVLAAGACTERPAPTSAPAEPSYVAVARGRVDVEGGLLEVPSPREGVVAEVCVKEGDRVEAGAELLRLDTRQDQEAVAVAQAQVDLARAQAGVVSTRLASDGDRIAVLEGAAAEGAVPGSEVDDVRAEVARLKAEEAAANATVELALRKLEAAKAALDRAVVHAPVAGRIVRCRVRAGALVASDASAPLVELLPDEPLVVRAWVSDAFASAVRPGMKARIVPDDDPDSAYAAHVDRLAPVSRPADLGGDAAEHLLGYYVECVLHFDDPAPDLRVGQPVLARIR